MTATQTPRRTSAYTIRLGGHDARRYVDQVAAQIMDRATLQDVGATTVTFRTATSDSEAYDLALDALAGLSGEWTLTTGLGVHRRQVTA